MLRRDVLYESKREGHAKSFNCLCVSKDQLYVGLGNGQIISIDKKSGRVVRRFFGHSAFVSSVLILPKQRRLVSSSYDGTIRAYSLNTTAVVMTDKSHTDAVNTMVFSNSNGVLYSSSFDGTVRSMKLGCASEKVC